MNDLGCYIYCTMIWDMHNFDWTDEENYQHYSHMSEEITEDEKWKRVKSRSKRFKIIEAFAQKSGVPLMSVKKYDRLRASYAYPFRKIIDHFNIPIHQSGDFLNSALSQAIAYAIYRDFNQIDLYGINVEMGTEWIYQRDAVSYWIGLARGQGRIVTCSGSSRRPTRIIDSRIYGTDIPQSDPSVKFVVSDPRKPKTFVKVYDESADGQPRWDDALARKEAGPHGKLWKTNKERVYIFKDWVEGSQDAVPEGGRRLPSDEATIEITEAPQTYRFSAEEREIGPEARVDVEEEQLELFEDEHLEMCERRKRD